ncbi:MAG: RDD family protein [Candidatus Bathyarchaeia archaeon]
MGTHDHENDHNRDITIETLSSPPIKINPAPLSKRFAAALIDCLILSIFWLFILHTTSSNLSSGLLEELLSISIVSFLYFLISEGFFAATLGKFVMKLRVVGKSGDPCSFTESLKRNILRFVDWLPTFYFVGAASIFLSQKRQRIGDRFAGTVVSVLPPRDSTPPPAPFLFH